MLWRGCAGADVAAASPVLVQMLEGRAQSRCRCGRGEPSPGADVGRGEPSPRSRTGSFRFGCASKLAAAAAAVMLGEAPTSAPGLGSPLPHLHRDWAHPCHICARTGLTACAECPTRSGRRGSGGRPCRAPCGPTELREGHALPASCKPHASCFQPSMRRVQALPTTSTTSRLLPTV